MSWYAETIASCGRSEEAESENILFNIHVAMPRTKASGSWEISKTLPLRPAQRMATLSQVPVLMVAVQPESARLPAHRTPWRLVNSSCAVSDEPDELPVVKWEASSIRSQLVCMLLSFLHSLDAPGPTASDVLTLDLSSL